MSLGHLHNPQAAAELIGDFKRRFSAKVCMAPLSDHDGGIVAAHTMSVEAVLRKIGADGHVYARDLGIKLSEHAEAARISRQGIRTVSVFNGFCARHDASLFSCLENEPFVFTRRQLFMLAYRATSRECYLKRKSYDSVPTLEQLKAMYGIEGEVRYHERTLLHQAATLRGAEELEQLKARLDTLYLEGAWNRMVSHAILFEKQPCLAACFTCEPFHDLDGNQLQDYEDLSATMSHLAVSVIPTDQGAAAIFSWLDSSNQAPRRYFDSVVASSSRTSAVIHTVLDISENFSLRPAWYESLGQDVKDYLVTRCEMYDATIAYSKAPRPERTAPPLDDWGPSVVAPF